MDDSNKYGLLLNQNAKLQRQYFREAVKLLGIKVLYRAPLPDKHYTTYAEIDSNYQIDKTRYLLTLEYGYSGHKLLNYLKEKNIQAEMSFSKGVVLILSPCNTDKDFEKIYNSIKELNINLIKSIEKNYIYRYDNKRSSYVFLSTILGAFFIFSFIYITRGDYYEKDSHYTGHFLPRQVLDHDSASCHFSAWH